MARVLGNPGQGARDRAIDMASQRLAHRYKNKVGNQQSKNEVASPPIKKAPIINNKNFDNGSYGLGLAIAAAAVAFCLLGQYLLCCIAFLISAVVLYRSKKIVVDNHNEAPVKALTGGGTDKQKRVVSKKSPVDFAKEDLLKEYDAVVAGKDVSETSFEGNELSWIYGSLGEVRTSKILGHELPAHYTVINDIDVKNKGKSVANIDHMVISPRGGIMVDTKIWGKPMVFKKEGDKTYIPRGEQGWDSISTFLYENDKAQANARFIVVAVGGKAGQSLKNNPVVVNHHYERYGENPELVRTPMTVAFAAQREVPALITSLDGIVNPAPNESERLIKYASFGP